MKIAFHSNQLGIRGTEVALYDYALGNRDILGNESIIISHARADLTSLDKFKTQFPVYLYNDFSEVESIVEREGIDAIYYIKAGFNDGKLVSNAKNLIHTVFKHNEPHGDSYAYVSEWLSGEMSNGELPFVPHMVNLPKHDLNYIDDFELKGKTVIGWYGGDNFDIPFARQAVIDVAKKRDDIVFLFMNSTPFADEPNIYFINGTTDLDKKVAFINTCDFMIHARERGETFGLTIAEFSTFEKPIITYFKSPERNHINILGDDGIYYSNYDELYEILIDIDPTIKGNNCYTDFTPEKVMNKFKEVFLKGGYEFNNWYNIIDDNIKPIKEIFDKNYKGEGVILDVGGNVGAFTDYVLSKYPNQEVHIFEPAFKFKEYLENKYKNTSVIFECKGISDVTSTSYIKCDNHNLGWNVISNKGEEISLITLDDYIEDNNITNISFVKIDVEFYEPFVLNGMKRFIERTKVLPTIVIEHNYSLSPYKEKQDEVFEWLFNYYEYFDYKNYNDTCDVILHPLKTQI